MAESLTAIPLDTAYAYERGKVDWNFFASLAMPDVFEFALPVFYLSVAQILVTRDPKNVGKILRFALGLPRGHAKTTFIKILLAWLIVYDYTDFVLIVCANEPLAENLLSDLNIILGSPNMESVYGNWSGSMIEDNKGTKQSFYHDRTVILVAKGAGSSLRGININNRRPSVIFCDDMQTKENDESPTESAKLLKWATGTLFKVLAPRGNRWIIYVGNMYSDHCLLYKFKQHKQWISLITGAILADGQPLWPELHSLESLMESFYHDEALGEADSWFAEVMNDPKETATTILPGPLPDSPIDNPEEIEWASTFITIDPAGFRKASDKNQIVVHGVYDGKGHVIRSEDGFDKPDEIIKEVFRLAAIYGCSLIGVESVGYQQTLAFWINFWMNALNIAGIDVVELSPHGRAKEARIRQFIQELYAGNYYITDSDSRVKFTWFASVYKLGKLDNKDDLLDGIAYGLDVRNDYWDKLKAPKKALSLASEARVVLDNTPF